jgi:hypothetical protein
MNFNYLNKRAININQVADDVRLLQKKWRVCLRDDNMFIATAENTGARYPSTRDLSAHHPFNTLSLQPVD